MCPLGIKFCCVLNVRTPPDAQVIKERENVGHKNPFIPSHHVVSALVQLMWCLIIAQGTWMKITKPLQNLVPIKVFSTNI